MLTYKQIKDASECCGKSCNECSCFSDKAGCAATSDEMPNTALALADMVLKLNKQREENGLCCRECGEAYGHKPDCELVKLLKGLEGDK